MIRVDISKAIPAAAYNYLAAFIPGLFFELSIILAKPELIRHLVEQLQMGFGPGYYTRIGIALILGFIIGNAFMLLVIFMQRLLGYVYRLKGFLRKELTGRLLLLIIRKLRAKDGWIQSHWLQRLDRYADDQNSQFSPQLMNIERCWHLLAGELLQRGYGIRADQSRRIDWGIWYAALTRPTWEDRRGYLLMVASHAAGWCGIAAAHYAPALRNSWYLGFSLFLIFSGVLHDWTVAKKKHNPVWQGMVRIGAALAELRETTAIKSHTSALAQSRETTDEQARGEA